MAARWAYGVTTVPLRRQTLLPRTLASLRAAGFVEPHLFVDGSDDSAGWRREFGLDVTARWPAVHVAGHWVLSLYELYVGQPSARYFALFQDDLVTYPHLREYLERCHFPETGYWNLYTFPQNEKLRPPECDGWYLSNQRGLGAVALVFSRLGVQTLLQSRLLTQRPLNAQLGWRNIDGGIITALTEAGWQEWVHYPSLVQHTGDLSSMNNHPHPRAGSFRGENYNVLQLLPC